MLWEELRQLRARVAASSSPRDFEAALKLSVVPGLHKRLSALGDNLREALVVSHLALVSAERADGDARDGVVGFELSPASGQKCARCWKFRELGVDPAHPSICADCAQVVAALKA